MSATSLALRVPEPLESGALAALRALLPRSPCPPRLSTGIAALDAVLPGRGIPRGRLTELVGRRGSGLTTVLREMVMATIARGSRVAVVDATRTLDPRDWAHDGDDDALMVIRPTDASRGAWCADVLLRSGAFALVVLDGAPAMSSAIATRLIRLARDANVALVIAAGATHERPPVSMLAGALRLRVARARMRRRPAIAITIEKGGGGGSLRRATVEVEYVVAVAHRVCSHPEVPDRRGVARSGARGRASAGVTAPPPPPAFRAAAGRAGAGRRVLPRKRRCAEPALGRSGAVG